MRVARLGWTLMCATLATIAVAQDEPPVRPVAAPIPIATDAPLPPVTTRHMVTIAGRRIPYKASWSETVLTDAVGTPQATISSTAYVREDVANRAGRPVIVAFNGGPGASSSPLHFSGFGPRILGERDAAGNRALIENPDSLIDAADLLFIDPVGTGFSRPLREGGGAAYWQSEGDAEAALDLVRAWLKANGRSNSPLFVAGESYGGTRAGLMARQMRDLPIAGLVLISPALGGSTSDDQEAINSLPVYAVAAWHHGKRQHAGPVEAVWEEARAFAQGEYAQALQLGNALPTAERDRLAARIAPMIGLPSDDIAAANLRVPGQRFLETLMPGQVVGRLDVRVVAPKPAAPLNPDRPAGANDPALGLGRSNVIISKPIGDYLRTELKVPTGRDYYSLSLDVNFNWNWAPREASYGGDRGVSRHIAALMRARPNTRLLVIGGYYDLAVPVLAPIYTLSHSAIPRDRVTTAFLPTGHSPFEGRTRAQAVAAVRQLLAGAAK
jgi:carboxypeptidase C (cathepsin A)